MIGNSSGQVILGMGTTGSYPGVHSDMAYKTCLGWVSCGSQGIHEFDQRRIDKTSPICAWWTGLDWAVVVGVVEPIAPEGLKD